MRNKFEVLRAFIWKHSPIYKAIEFKRSWNQNQEERNNIKIKEFIDECTKYKLFKDDDSSASLKTSLENSNVGVVYKDTLVSLGYEIGIYILNPMLATAVFLVTRDVWLAAISTVISQGLARGPYLVYRAAQETKNFREYQDRDAWEIIKNELYHTAIIASGFITGVGIITMPFLSKHRNEEYTQVLFKLWQAKFENKLPRRKI